MQDKKVFSSSEEAEKAFYDSFQNGDLHIMMAVWADDTNITCIHPGGTRLEGQINIRESWEQIFSHENDIKFEINQKRILQENEIAIHHVIESIYMSGELQSEIIATNIYRKGKAGWNMILHHASPELRPAIAPIQDETEISENEPLKENKTFH